MNCESNNNKIININNFSDMTKLNELTEETKNIVLDIAAERGLEHLVYIQGFDAIGQKKNVIKVSKGKPEFNYQIKTDESICVYINEEAFGMLSDRQKRILVEDALNCVRFDLDKGRIVFDEPTVTVTIGGRKKYGDELLDAAEAAVIALEQIQEREKERKAAEREAKKGNKVKLR